MLMLGLTNMKNHDHDHLAGTGAPRVVVAITRDHGIEVPLEAAVIILDPDIEIPLVATTATEKGIAALQQHYHR